MPDKIHRQEAEQESPFRHPTIGMPDKMMGGAPLAQEQFRHPTIGMPDKINALDFTLNV